MGHLSLVPEGGVNKGHLQSKLHFYCPQKAPPFRGPNPFGGPQPLPEPLCFVARASASSSPALSAASSPERRGHARGLHSLAYLVVARREVLEWDVVSAASSTTAHCFGPSPCALTRGGQLSGEGQLPALALLKRGGQLLRHAHVWIARRGSDGAPMARSLSGRLTAVAARAPSAASGGRFAHGGWRAART